MEFLKKKESHWKLADETLIDQGSYDTRRLSLGHWRMVLENATPTPSLT